MVVVMVVGDEDIKVSFDTFIHSVVSVDECHFFPSHNMVDSLRCASVDVTRQGGTELN